MNFVGDRDLSSERVTWREGNGGIFWNDGEDENVAAFIGDGEEVMVPNYLI